MLNDDLIILRTPEPSDVDFMLEMENNPIFWRVSETNFPFSRFDIESFIFDNKHDIFVQKQLRLMICLVENSQIVGMIDLFDFNPIHRRAGVGILINPSDQEKGYAARSLQIIENHVVKFFNMNQLYCHIQSDNLKSISLFTKLGYIQQGVFKNWELYDGEFKDVLFFQKLL